MAMSVGNFNTPVAFANNTTFALSGTAAGRHPSGHIQLLQDGYDTYEVLRSEFKFDVQWQGADRTGAYAVFAYKFGSLAITTSEPIFTAGAVTNETWLDMQASARWVWKKFGTSADGDRKTFFTHTIVIPNVRRLVRAIAEPGDNLLISPGDFRAALGDDSVGPLSQAFLHVVAFIITKANAPTQLITNDIVIDLRCKQTVRLWKNIATAEMIDEGDDTV